MTGDSHFGAPDRLQETEDAVPARSGESGTALDSARGYRHSTLLG